MDAATFLVENAGSIISGLGLALIAGVLYVSERDVRRVKQNEKDEQDKTDRLYQQKIDYYERQTKLAEHRMRQLLVGGLSTLEEPAIEVRAVFGNQGPDAADVYINDQLVGRATKLTINGTQVQP